MQRTLKNRLKTVDLNVPKLVKLEDVTLLCLASSTRPRRRNLLAALAQYTVSHFRSSSTKSSSWFLSSLLLSLRLRVYVSGVPTRPSLSTSRLAAITRQLQVPRFGSFCSLYGEIAEIYEIKRWIVSFRCSESCLHSLWLQITCTNCPLRGI